jgi:NADH:ubiquinone oxidoreductase subunit B-like Fe-S oxidoreductase
MSGTTGDGCGPTPGAPTEGVHKLSKSIDHDAEPEVHEVFDAEQTLPLVWSV